MRDSEAFGYLLTHRLQEDGRPGRRRILDLLEEVHVVTVASQKGCQGQPGDTGTHDADAVLMTGAGHRLIIVGARGTAESSDEPGAAPMVNSVEALVDAAADARIRLEWAELEAHGMPNQGRHRGASNRPHITMVVAATMDAALDQRFRAAVGALPLPIRIGELTCFGSGPFVLVRLVELTPDLLACQAAVADVVGIDNLGPLSRPEVWTPHLTLARRLGATHVEEAMNRLENLDLASGPASVTGVRRWDGDAKREWMLTGEDGRHD